MLQRIISIKKSIVVSADVKGFNALGDLVEGVSGVPGVEAIKLGFTLGLRDLARAVDLVRQYMGPKFPVIYDHQKAGNDIPEMGQKFAESLRNAGVDAAILFPFAGPATQKAWTKACFDVGLQVITGGLMTTPQFLVSEGGYIADESIEKIYRNGCQMGCSHFVVPGTKLDWIPLIRSWIADEIGEGNYVLYSPGFVTQKGVISECGKVAGDEWHAIVGGAIYAQTTKVGRRQAAITMTSQILA